MKNPPKYCQVCLSNRIVILNSSVYCEKCDVYYQIENNNQFVSAIPVSEMDTFGPELCSKCSARKMNDKKIKCTGFNDYYNKIRLCKLCKVTNKEYLKNLYYRNFILCKKIKNTYGTLYKISFIWLIIFSLTTQHHVSDLIIKTFLRILETVNKENLTNLQQKLYNLLYKVTGKVEGFEERMDEENRSIINRIIYKIFNNPFVSYIYKFISS